MESSETKLKLLSIARSTTSIYQFQELRHAISDLDEATKVELVISGSEQLKQIFQSSCMIEWRKV